MKKSSVLYSLPLAVVSILCAGSAANQLAALHAQNALGRSAHEELYLPSGKGLSLFATGFKNVMADLLWFRTINYFGREFASTRDYRYLEHYINLVVDMNPRKDFVYQFGSMMFAWELNNPRASIDLLTKGITALPQSWLLQYYRGFMYFYFLNEQEKALADFRAAATKPNAHPMIAKLAERLDRTTALQTLSETTDDASLKSFLQTKQ